MEPQKTRWDGLLDSANAAPYIVYYLVFSYVLLLGLSYYAVLNFDYWTSRATRSYCHGHGLTYSAQLREDLTDHILQFALTFTLIYSLPLTQTFISNAGGNSMTIYIAHKPLFPIFCPFIASMQIGSLWL